MGSRRICGRSGVRRACRRADADAVAAPACRNEGGLQAPPAAAHRESGAGSILGRSLFWDSADIGVRQDSVRQLPLSPIWAGRRPSPSAATIGKLTSRRSQPLIGVGHAQSLIGWDGRSATLEAQAQSSIATGSMSMRETDAPVKVEVIEERIRAVPEYVAKFNAALPGTPIDIDFIAKAIAAYERAIEPGIAPFDRWIEGDESTISELAKRGFVLFNGKGECFLCHSGWRFTNDSFHDIGTTTTDNGRGRQLQTERADAIRLQDPDPAFGGIAPTFYARRVGGGPVPSHEALREGRH